MIGLVLAAFLLARPPADGPLAGAVIVVDPGHGGQSYSKSYTGGTRGTASRLTESELNLRVALELAKKLRANGATVHMTRVADHRLSREGSSQADELHARVDFFEHHNCHFFLSVHHNAGPATTTGHTALYKHNAADDTLYEAAARTANDALAAAVPGPKRALIKGSYHILRETDIPGTITEAGFMTNRAFDDLANTAGFPAAEADAICAGAVSYWAAHKPALVALRDKLAAGRAAKPRDPNTYTATALNPAFRAKMAARTAKVVPGGKPDPAHVGRYLAELRKLAPPAAGARDTVTAEFADGRIRLAGETTDRAFHDRLIDLLVALKLYDITNDIRLPKAARPMKSSLTRDQASVFAKLGLKNIRREYPNKPEHVLAGPADALTPQALHPAFYGCYDWHSAVHAHWMLARLVRLYPDLPEAADIRAVLGQHLTPEAVKAEAAYFARPDSRSFERPYGWAWLLKLAEELHRWDDPVAKKWVAALRPLVDVVVARYLGYFPKQTYPIRTGVHPNTAFGLAFAHDYAATTGHAELRRLVEERAKAYFGADADAPARWEPSGADFFSPTLMEADLMRRVLPAAEFRGWFAKFLPAAAAGEPVSLFAPAVVTDRADPQLVHLDGLNLSRAWAMKGVAASLPVGDPARAVLVRAADRHAADGLKHVASGDYAGEHWLATFAVYLLTATPG